MQITVETKKLKLAAGAVATALSQGVRSSSDLLTQQEHSWVWYNAQVQDRLTLESGVEGAYARCTMAASVVEPGSVAVIGAHLNSLKVPGSTLTVTHNPANQNDLVITSGTMRVELNGTVGDGSQITPLQSFVELTHSVPARALQRAVELVTFSQVIQGDDHQLRLRLRLGENRLAAMSSDSLCGASYQWPVECPNPVMDVTIPARYLASLLSMYGEEDLLWLGTDGTSFRIYSEYYDVQFPLIQSRGQDEVRDISVFLEMLFRNQPVQQFSFNPADARTAVDSSVSINKVHNLPSSTAVIQQSGNRALVTSRAAHGGSYNEFMITPAADKNSAAGDKLYLMGEMLISFLNLLRKTQESSVTLTVAANQLCVLQTNGISYLIPQQSRQD